MEKKDEMLLTDMSQCQPSSALSTRRKKGHWQLLDYEGESVRGTMILCGPETGAPELTLPLNRKGWHRIYVGCRGNWAGVNNLLKVRLTGDPAFTCIEPEGPDTSIEEGFWKAADLTGQNLIISPHNTGVTRAANLAMVRLAPLSDSEVAALKQEQAQPQSRRLIARNDGHGLYYGKRPTTAEEILEDVEVYRNTDFGWLFWERGSAPWQPMPPDGYPGQGAEDFPAPGYRYIAESMEELAGRGIKPLRVVLEHAHRLGMKCGFSLRMGLYLHCPPFEEPSGRDFFDRHPDLRCRDRDGTEVARLSYAFPEVRKLVISMFEEVSELGADGIGLLFTRGLPVLLYEEPLVEGFKTEFGTDPRELAEDDPRWLRYRAGVFTGFMRELRRRLDAIAERQGRERLAIAANVLVDEEDNLFYGLDTETWAREGLVDILMPFQWWYWCEDKRYEDGTMKELDMDFFARITKGTSCQLRPDVLLQSGLFPPLFREEDVGTPENFLKLALRLYEAGAEGFSFWDTNRYYQHLTPWQVVRNLGHPVALLKKWLEDGTFQPRTIPLKKIGGLVVDRYPPHWSG